MDVKEKLKKAVLINIEDAKRLIGILEAEGDSEGLKRAQADLMKWEEKARDLGIAENE